MTIDLEELAAVIRLLKEADFSEFNYSRGDTVLQVRRGEISAGIAFPAPVGASAVVQPATPPASTASMKALAASTPSPKQVSSPVTPVMEIEGAKVRAPFLGTFYSAPKPGEPVFVRPGDRVEPDTVVCIIEVMKLMNSITAGVSGVIAAVHSRDGDFVEFDQPLFTVVEAK